VDNKAAIPPNIIAVANTESNSCYLRYCQENGLIAHPARYPADIPEYFIRMLTDTGDLVVDPFAGSCVTGEVAERLQRRWICGELVEDYLKGALSRFRSQKNGNGQQTVLAADSRKKSVSYKLSHPAALWDEPEDAKLNEDGGKKRCSSIQNGGSRKVKPKPKKE
jgi:DNA modification methylase